MTRPIVYRREAQAEFDEAFDWYDGRRAGLGNDFADCVQQAIDRIAANPLLHGIVHTNVRCALVHRFPYGVYYSVEPSRVVVVAVFHGSRDPRIWQSRVDQ